MGSGRAHGVRRPAPRRVRAARSHGAARLRGGTDPPKVGSGAFSPVPRVESAVVRLRPRPRARRSIPAGRDRFRRHRQDVLLEKRRKTLRNALRGLCDESTIAAADLDPRSRPEVLTVGRVSSALARTRVMGMAAETAPFDLPCAEPAAGLPSLTSASSLARLRKGRRAQVRRGWPSQDASARPLFTRICGKLCGQVSQSQWRFVPSNQARCWNRLAKIFTFINGIFFNSI